MKTNVKSKSNKKLLDPLTDLLLNSKRNVVRIPRNVIEELVNPDQSGLRNIPDGESIKVIYELTRMLNHTRDL